ncbi:phosphotransferase [Nakamurella alba]|uniref:phosphotransferase n=1 Tax=Nakamurella alba TaxID=2665158 RepID=UPI0018AAEF21|nr:phosphotransferase [Nakamurella alba]
MDPDVPGFPVATDPDRLAGWLEQVGAPAAGRLRYRRWKPGTSVVLALEIGGRPAFLFAVADHARPKVAKYVRKAPDAVLAVDEAAGVLLAGPGADRDLPGLRTPPDGQPLAWKPMRRWVSRSADGSVLRRCYRAGRSTDALLRYRSAVGATVATSPVLGHDPDTATLELGFLPGRPAGPQDLVAVGAALARWHATPITPAVPAAGAPAWRESAAMAARLVPGLAPRIAGLVALTGALPSRPPAPALVHGDCSLDQLLIEPGGGVALLDLDRAGTGSAVDDLASLRMAAPDDSGWPDLLAGYGQATAPPVPDLRDLLVAGLGRLTDPFRSCAAGWVTDTAGMVRRMESLAVQR